jgi:ATPase subunit of ABC transporter with duplicated ATPase domains
VCCPPRRPPVRSFVAAHLDSDSIEALIDALAAYTGAVLLVSHDRHAVKRIVQRERRVSTQDEDSDSSAESESGGEEDEERRPGRVFLVRNSRCSLLEGGIDEYTRQVQRELDSKSQ